ncbi:MAG: hypothetical protein WDW38_003803 [Sanguina aurantia]
MSAPLVWECIKNFNSFQRKGLNFTRFSAEKGNLYALSTYKHSGLANAKTVHIEADGSAVTVSKSRSKATQKPKTSQSTVTMKRSARRVLAAVGKEVAGFRPDLKKAAVARAAFVLKSIRVQKAKKV